MFKASKIAHKFCRKIFPHKLQNGLKTGHSISSFSSKLVKAGLEKEAILVQLKEEFLPKPEGQDRNVQRDNMDGFCGSLKGSAYF